MAEKKRSLKQKIRDTKRLLARKEIPETVRLTKERVLHSLQQDLRDKIQDEKRKKLAKKYRMIRFFGGPTGEYSVFGEVNLQSLISFCVEKRKVAKRLKSRVKELSSSTDESERAEIVDDIHRLRRELNYIEHYPAGEKYISLYPSEEGTSAKALEHREKILSQIADQVESGELSDASRSEAKSIKDESAVIAVTSEGKKGTQYLPANEGDMSEQKDRQPVSQPLVSDVQQSKNIQVGNRRTRSGTKRFVAPVDEEPDSDSDLYLEPKKKLREDNFFLQDSENST